MILTGPKIREERTRGSLLIDPFDDAAVQPNSYDFTLGSKLLYYTEPLLDCAKENPHEIVEMGADGFLLQPDRIYLGHTKEVMGSNHYVPIIRGRSSFARLGLFVHVTSDLIDIGSHNQWTLQLHAVQPLRIYPGMKVGQVTFWTVQGPVTLYTGKYQGARGPRASMSYLEFATTK